MLVLAVEITLALSTGELKQIKDLGTRPEDLEGTASFVNFLAMEGLKFLEKRKELEG